MSASAVRGYSYEVLVELCRVENLEPAPRSGQHMRK